jgi:GNAT superfamily N-acetyltransferase
VAEAGAVLTRAFRDNPLNVAVIGAASSPARRDRCNGIGMRNLLRAGEGPGLLLGARAAGRLAGVLVAAPPYAFPFPAPPLAAQLQTLFLQGLRVASRWREVFEALQRRHDVAPHWYLGVVGVDPPNQGQGLGGALLDAWLRHVDAAGLPATLETDRPENLRFYGRVGFVVTGELDVVGAHIWCLRRPARGTVSSAPGLR